MPQCAASSVAPVRPSTVALTARCTAWSALTQPAVSVSVPQAKHTNPACLPEQLLCSAEGRAPVRASVRAAVSRIGQCTPHSSVPTSRPALASIAAAAATCAGSPEWDEHASASSGAVRPNRSAAPLSTSGRACMALMAERGYTGVSTSPSASTSAPRASHTATALRWRLSTRVPRVTSTTTGFSRRRLWPSNQSG